MDSDEDEQIGVKKQAAKKGKGGRKKSTTTAAKTKSNKKSASSTPTRGRRIKSQMVDSSSDEEPAVATTKSAVETPSKRQKLDESSIIVEKPKPSTSTTTADDLLFKKLDVDKLTELPTGPISTQIFTATPRLNSVPLHENKPLNWSHKINLIGEKSHEQRVHLCDICKEPILYYGRLLNCKHVFCYDCAIDLQGKGSGCLRCNERIIRCERNALNSVYMCNHDKQCKRTYLSQRDLLAHIQHRHTKKEKSNSSSEKSLKLRSTYPSSFSNNNISKEEFQSAPYLQKPNNGHHYPQPSAQTFRWVKNIQNYSEQTIKDGRKPK